MNWKLKALLTPSCWLQHAPYCKVWDKKLNDLMDKNKFVIMSKYTAKLGKITLWVSNHPYASFMPHVPELNVRPSRATILKAHYKMMRDVFEV